MVIAMITEVLEGLGSEYLGTKILGLVITRRSTLAVRLRRNGREVVEELNDATAERFRASIDKSAKRGSKAGKEAKQWLEDARPGARLNFGADTSKKPKKKSVEPWLKDLWQAGEDFNKENRGRYPYNEVEVVVNGRKFRVDSLDPEKKEIIFRRLTQFSKIQQTTAENYFREFKQKYPVGAEISASLFNPKNLRGRNLQGRLVFEIPVQWRPTPDSVLEAAERHEIIIRDVTGKIYNR